jgi:two-component system, cell cycle sensor histidine kinase and response regulator CckA
MDAPRILVVDDDEAVRYAVCLALSGLGCVVDSVSGAGEALARFRPGRYRAVVTDVGMPRMNGLELARRLRALEPSLPIMIFSGEPTGELVEGTLLTLKPDIEGLTRLIERTLAPS